MLVLVLVSGRVRSGVVECWVVGWEAVAVDGGGVGCGGLSVGDEGGRACSGWGLGLLGEACLTLGRGLVGLLLGVEGIWIVVGRSWACVLRCKGCVVAVSLSWVGLSSIAMLLVM